MSDAPDKARTKEESKAKQNAPLERQLHLMLQHCLFGQVHYRMWRRLNDGFLSDPELIHFTPSFLLTTTDAQLNSALLILNRLIDTHRDALSIEQFLKQAKGSADIFLHSTPGKVREAVAEDLARLASMESTLGKIRDYRNEQFVHLGKALLKPPYGVIPADEAFEYREVGTALAVIGEILNRYAGFLLETEFLMELPGEEQDFLYLWGLILKAR